MTVSFFFYHPFDYKTYIWFLFFKLLFDYKNLYLTVCIDSRLLVKGGGGLQSIYFNIICLSWGGLVLIMKSYAISSKLYHYYETTDIPN